MLPCGGNIILLRLSQLLVPLWPSQVAEQLPWCHNDPACLIADDKWVSPELVHTIDTAWKHDPLDLQHEGLPMQT